jgi:DNA invertase Pin-like site-specific DNA recombinase
MLAYSYYRLSDPKQSRGHGLTRQEEMARGYCARRGWKLDDTLDLRDVGVSAFHGKNRDHGALATFLAAIKEGMVKRGSALIVESVDRISRQGIDEGYDLCKRILKAGVHIVTLSPERDFGPEAVTGLAKGALELLIILERAHEESKMKSERIKAKWAAVRARRGIYGQRPGWLRVTKDRKFEIIPQHAATVRQIFELVVQGHGVGWVAKKLNETGAPLMGGFKKSKTWSKSYVAKIVRNRAVIGEHRPGRLDPESHKRVETGEVWAGHYPEVVSPAVFWKAQGLLTQRKGFPGRKDRGTTNFFRGLIYDARDGTKMGVTYKTNKGAKYQRMLTSSGASQGVRGSMYCSFPLALFERAFLELVTELRPEDVLPREPDQVEDEIATLEGQLGDLDARIARVKEEAEAHPNLDALLDLLVKLAESRKAMAQRLDAARSKRANGERESLREVQSLSGMLDGAAGEELEALRSRLQSAIRGLVKEIWLLVVKLPGGRMEPKICAGQVWFRLGDQPRSLLLTYFPKKPGTAPSRTLDPADPDTGHIDLRRREHARDLEQALLEADLDAIE